MNRFFQGCLAVGLAFAMGACANKKKEAFTGVDGDYVTGTPLPSRIEGANFFSANVNRSQFQPVYFGYDSFSVSDSEMTKVSGVAASLKEMPNDVIIAGFTDQRGTEEYNRGLGEKRAQAVRDALISMGVNGSRIQTVSFGEEMPADPGDNESGWAKNRRAEIGVIK